MFKASLLFSVATAGILGAAYGCSSSSSNPPGSPGGTDSGAPPVTTPDGSATQTDGSPSTSDDGGAAQSEDSGPTCPANVSSSDIPTYTPTTQTLGSCTAAQITAFVTACASQNATGKTCNTWFNDAANTTCGDCISPIDATGNPITGGATLVNPTTGDPLTNTPGCVALEDSTNGAACATPLANYEECEDVACSQCSTDATFTACGQSSSVRGGTCASYYSSFSSVCASELVDGGIAASNGECQDPGFVATLYCGGADGGAPSDGGDGG